ncbi:MAG: Sec-independent protein translocase protein TatB [Actinomycetota bacterium]|nr:Sec-independent protein translocase protein TatB [Actinomycetota bacterium]
MGSIGAPEILVILVVALLVLGPNRLPEAARQVGRAMAEMRRMSAGFQAEIRDAMQTPAAGPPVPPAPSTDVTAAPAPKAEQKYLWSDLPGATDDAST